MLFHCNALSPDRWKDQRFLAVYNRFIPVDLTRDQAWELAVCLRTKGFVLRHWFALFNWKTGDNAVLRDVNSVIDYFANVASVQDAANENALSITQADGVAWVKAVLEVKPQYRGSVPLWVQLALSGLADEGLTDLEIGKALGGLPGVSGNAQLANKVREWRRAVLFDPLTGSELALDHLGSELW